MQITPVPCNLVPDLRCCYLINKAFLVSAERPYSKIYLNKNSSNYVLYDRGVISQGDLLANLSDYRNFKLHSVSEYLEELSKATDYLESLRKSYKSPYRRRIIDSFLSSIGFVLCDANFTTYNSYTNYFQTIKVSNHSPEIEIYSGFYWNSITFTYSLKHYNKRKLVATLEDRCVTIDNSVVIT